MKNKYRCTAHIRYEVHIWATSVDQASEIVAELLGDDVTAGIIRTDLFNNGEDTKDFRFPRLVSVAAKEMKE